MQPAAILRSWANTLSTTPSATHNIDFKVQFLTSGVVDASKDQTFSATFASAKPTDSDDQEFSFLIKNFTGFDSVV